MPDTPDDKKWKTFGQLEGNDGDEDRRLKDLAAMLHPYTREGAYGKYCSEHCQEAKDVAEIRCDCKHSPCN